jgi:GNAT superfamily N-acetyltransferase
VRIAEYDRSRLGELADLHGRVWGERPDEAELDWFYGGNPVAPASVLLAEEDGAVVGAVALSYLRLALGGEEMLAGMPVGLATDPAFRGRGVFATLQAENEERARAAGARLLYVVPTPASASVLLGRLGWTALAPIRIWGRLRVWRGRVRARIVERFESGAPTADEGVVRDAAWLDWRFADSPRSYRLLAGDGYAVAGRHGRVGVVAAVAGDLLADAVVSAPGRVVVASPPPAERRRYALAGFAPTPRTLALLGKSLDPALPLPEHPHFELGDLDFV